MFAFGSDEPPHLDLQQPDIQAEPDRLDEVFRYGMWINVAAAMGVEDLSAGCEWMRSEVATQLEP